MSFNGFDNLERQVINGLRVGQLAGRNPVRWNVTCTRCGTSTIEQHQRLTTRAVVCRNNGCGREAVRETVSDSPAKARRRQDAAESARRREEAERQTARVVEAESALSKTHGELLRVVKNRVSTGPDDEVWQDPATINLRMTEEQARTFNAEEADKFLAANPSYFPSPGNFRTIAGYLSNNGLNIVSALTLARAVARLDSVGLIEHRPAPAPEPAFETRPTEVNLTVDRSSLPEPSSGLDGWDLLTGEQRHYSNFELERLSADDFKKAFRITREKQTLARRLW